MSPAGMVVRACNPNTQETKARESLQVWASQTAEWGSVSKRKREKDESEEYEWP